MSPLPPIAPATNHLPSLRQWRRRAVFLWSIAIGLLVPTYFLGIAETSHLAWDFRAYYTAATAVLGGEPFVGASPGIPGVSYVYPPISVLLFVPQAAAGSWWVAFLLQMVVNVLAGLGLGYLTIRFIETHRGRLPTKDRALIVAFCLGTAPAAAVLGLGQVDLLVAVAIAGAFVALEHDHESVAGAALGGAALVKVFPVVLGVWLVWRRAWRAVTTAIVTGVSGLVLGAVLFGVDAYTAYFEVLAGRSRVSEFAGTVSPNFFALTLYRPFSQLLPSVDPLLYGPLAVAVLAVPVTLVAVRQDGVTDRLSTYLVAVVAMVLMSPASNCLYVVYAYFPLLSLVYLMGSGRARSLLLVGTAAVSFPVQPAQIAASFALIGVPTAVSTPVLTGLQSALTVASIPLVGLLVIVVGCTLYSMRAVDAVPETTRHVSVRR